MSFLNIQVLCLAVIFLHVNILRAQEAGSIGVTDIKGVILDASTDEPLMYATVFEKKSGKGTVSDEDGKFSLRQVPKDFLLEVGMLGYETKTLSSSDLTGSGKILLKSRTELLDAVVVYGENEYFYSLVRKCRRTESKRPRTAKTYFLLETSVDEQILEILECYYNGTYWGYDLEELKLKNGRIALDTRDNRFFVSTETSRAINLQKIMDRSEFFPVSPLQLSKRVLKKHFRLRLFSKFKNDKGQTIFGIDYAPRENKDQFFAGKMWIDSASYQLQKITMECPTATIHPFVPISRTDSLIGVDLNIARTYESHADNMYLRSLDFIYNLTYRTDQGSVYKVSTSAVLYAFDFGKTFPLPHFEFTEDRHLDYRQINGSVYNDWFWKNKTEFSIPEKEAQLDSFMTRSKMSSRDNLFQPNRYFDRGILEHPYIRWSKNRIRMRKSLEDQVENVRLKPGDSGYDLEVQIYMDVNEDGDSIHAVTATTFDPYKSYLLSEPTSETTAFVNMYFDLMEIQRRKLVEALQVNANSPKDAEKIYLDIKAQAEEMAREFFMDVDRGQSEPGMRKWNQYVIAELGIDNVRLFGLYDKNKD